MQPGTSPRNSCVSEYSPYCATRGVADVTASVAKAALDIRLVQEASSTARAASAGFMKFCPRPPKSCLMITMAMPVAITGAQSGMVTGRL